jgi:heptaprenyl diphosphate synthase
MGLRNVYTALAVVRRGQSEVRLMPRFEQFRARRREVYERLFGAQALFIAGLIIMPALLFNSNTLSRVFQFLFFWVLAWLSGKKNSPLFTLLVIVVIVAFNLIIPYGRVLFSVGVFRITSGALEAGVHRAVTLEGLVMLSRVTVRQDIRIPGLFGELIGESFRVFAVITDRKQSISAGVRKNFMADIDRLMLELSGDDVKAPQPGGPLSRTKTAGFIILAAAVILSWLPLIVNYKTR